MFVLILFRNTGSHLCFRLFLGVRGGSRGIADCFGGVKGVSCGIDCFGGMGWELWDSRLFWGLGVGVVG